MGKGGGGQVQGVRETHMSASTHFKSLNVICESQKFEKKKGNYTTKQISFFQLASQLLT